MQRHSGRCWSLLIICLLAGGASANEVVLKAGLVRMLDVGWSVTPTARAAADAQYV